MIAIMNNHLEIAILLIEQGSNINIKENKGFSPLMAASANGFEEVLKLILN